MARSRRDVFWACLGVAIGTLVVWAGIMTLTAPSWDLGHRYGALIEIAGGAAIATSLLTLVRPILGGRSTVAAAAAVTLAWALAAPWAFFVILPASIALGFVGARRLRAAGARSV